jgi:excisionase family DNA binding protein
MLTLGQAARLTKLGKTTLARAIKAGRLSATRNDSGTYQIDPAELSRVYPFPAAGKPAWRLAPPVPIIALGRSCRCALAKPAPARCGAPSPQRCTGDLNNASAIAFALPQGMAVV